MIKENDEKGREYKDNSYFRVGMLRIFAFASNNANVLQMFCECGMCVQIAAYNCNEPSTRADCSAKSLISNLAGIPVSSSEDEGSHLESGVNRNTQEREIKVQLKSYLKEKRASIDENLMDWWKTKLKYDTLSDFARGCLRDPPASVPSERSRFYIYMSHSGQTAAKLLCLKYNLPLLKFDY